MSTIYLSEKKEYRALDFSKFVAAFLVAAIHIPPFEEIRSFLCAPAILSEKK